MSAKPKDKTPRTPKELQTKKSAWEKKAMGVFGLKRPKPGATPASQMPAYSDPVELDVGGYSLIYQNGVWRGAGAGIMETEEASALRDEVQRLKDENQHILEENCMLDFKIQLLTDMLALRTLDLEKERALRKPK